MCNTNWTFKSWHCSCLFPFTPLSFLTAKVHFFPSSSALAWKNGTILHISCLDHWQSGTQTDRWFRPESQLVAAYSYLPSSTAPVWPFCSVLQNFPIDGWSPSVGAIGSSAENSQNFSPHDRTNNSPKYVIAAHAETSYYDNPAHHHSWPAYWCTAHTCCLSWWTPPTEIITLCKLVLRHGWITVDLKFNIQEEPMGFLLIN